MNKEELNERLYKYVSPRININIGVIEVEKLFKQGADSNYLTKNSHLSLFKLSCHCSIEYIELFLKYGAVINYQDIEGRTVLHEICMCINNDSEKCKYYKKVYSFLISKGADYTIKDKSGKYPIDHLNMNKSTAEEFYHFLKEIEYADIRRQNIKEFLNIPL